MKLDQFITELAALDMPWQVNPDGLIRSKGEQFHCPITAVCFVRTGHDFDPCDYKQAGEEIGLDPEDQEEIMETADGQVNATRFLLLKACKLEGTR